LNASAIREGGVPDGYALALAGDGSINSRSAIAMVSAGFLSSAPLSMFASTMMFVLVARWCPAKL